MELALARVLDTELEELLNTEVEPPQLPSDDELDRMTDAELEALVARCDAYNLVTLIRKAYLAGRIAGSREVLDAWKQEQQELHELQEETRDLREETADLKRTKEELDRTKEALHDEAELALGLHYERNGSIVGLAGDARIVQAACRSFRRDYGYWPDWWSLLARLMSIEKDGLRDMTEREARHRINDALQICAIRPQYAPPPPDDGGGPR